MAYTYTDEETHALGYDRCQACYDIRHRECGDYAIDGGVCRCWCREAPEDVEEGAK